MLQRNNPFAKFIKKVTQNEHVQSNESVQQNQQQRNVFDFNNQGNIKAIFQNSIQQRDFQKQKPKKESKQQKKSAKNNTRQIMQQKKELISNTQKTKVQVDFSSYPLCCRTYFFDQERILQAENRSLEYKSYRFPFTGPSTETFKKTICSFLNTIGGDIYIGIKETTVKKFRYVLGNYLTENDKEQVLKSFRKITESIYPNITQALQVEFIPIRKNPFPYTNLVGQLETYLYDFTKKPLNLKKCPYQGGRYVIRVRVPSGNKGVLYSYVQTEYQLNKNSNSNEFVAFRSQNEVLVKQMCQEVLKRFKQKLLYEKQQDHKIHDEPCIKPQIGDPRTQPEPEDQKIDAKQIQAVLYQNILRKRHPEERKENNDKKDSSDQEKAKLQLPTDANDVQVTEDELGAILKYPLTFVVKNMTEEKLKKCIDKTPAKNYTKIQTFKDVLIKVNRVLITIAGYHNMSNFLNIKSRIQDHFHKDCVEFIGVSKIMQFQSANNRKQMEKMLSINENHKFIINKNIIEFDSLVVGASYFMYMKALGYDMQVLRK